EQVNVYVVPFPAPGSPSQVSTGGGILPTWSQTRHELLYSTFDGQIMIVNYSEAGSSFRSEPPRPWPGARYNVGTLLGTRFRDYDLHPDGNRLALAVDTEPSLSRRYSVEIFLNFFDELRRIAPAGKH